MSFCVCVYDLGILSEKWVDYWVYELNIDNIGIILVT